MTMPGSIWYCKIGEARPVIHPADPPMRSAIDKIFRELTGVESSFIFSGWGATLTEQERAVVENRAPAFTKRDEMLEVVWEGVRLLNPPVSHGTPAPFGWSDYSIKLVNSLPEIAELLKDDNAR